MLDSLVRVSRRVNENHFVRIAIAHRVTTPSTTPSPQQSIVIQTQLDTQQARGPSRKRRTITSSIQADGRANETITEIRRLLPSSPAFSHSTELILTHQQLQRPPTTTFDNATQSLTNCCTPTPVGLEAIDTHATLVFSASLLAISSTF